MMPKVIEGEGLDQEDVPELDEPIVPEVSESSAPVLDQLYHDAFGRMTTYFEKYVEILLNQRPPDQIRRAYVALSPFGLRCVPERSKRGGDNTARVNYYAARAEPEDIRLFLHEIAGAHTQSLDFDLANTAVDFFSRTPEYAMLEPYLSVSVAAKHPYVLVQNMPAHMRALTALSLPNPIDLEHGGISTDGSLHWLHSVAIPTTAQLIGTAEIYGVTDIARIYKGILDAHKYFKEEWE